MGTGSADYDSSSDLKTFLAGRLTSMKRTLYIAIIALSQLATFGQHATREADGIKKAVGLIAVAKKPDVEVVTRDLRELKGKIIGVYEDNFVIEVKQPKKRSITIISIGNVPPNRKPPINIRYRDVLQIEGKGALLSFVPDPKLTRFSEWNAIPTVGVGAMLQVHTKDGKKIHGVFTTRANDRLRLMQGNTQTEIQKEDIVRVYQLAGDLDGLAAKLFGGGRRGAEVAEDILPILDAAARAHPLGLALGAAIGVATAGIMHVLPKGGVKRVLLYAQ
jgi:hypothetical protein